MMQTDPFPLYTNCGFSHAVAMQYGISAAMVLNRIIWSINYHIEKREKYAAEYFIEDQWWMDDTHQNIARHFRGLISERTVRLAVKAFESAGILVSNKQRSAKWNHTKWYRLDREKYLAVHAVTEPAKNATSDSTRKNEPVDAAKNATSKRQKMTDQEAAKNATSSSLNSPTHNHTNTTPPTAVRDPHTLTLAKKPKPLKHQPEDAELASKWLPYAKSVMPSQQGWTEEGFANDIAKVRVRLAISHEAMREVFDFITHDKFWEDIAVAPGRLLNKTKGSDIRKIDWIISKMTKSGRKAMKVAQMANSVEDPF